MAIDRVDEARWSHSLSDLNRGLCWAQVVNCDDLSAHCSCREVLKTDRELIAMKTIVLQRRHFEISLEVTICMLGHGSPLRVRSDFTIGINVTDCDYLGATVVPNYLVKRDLVLNARERY